MCPDQTTNNIINMKNRIYTMKGMLATLLGAFLLGYAVTGCIDEKDHYKPDDKTSGVPNLSLIHI